MDRLLSPDLTLQSSVGDKQFNPGGGSISTKKAATKSFYLRQRLPEKNYPDARRLEPKEFRTNESAFAQRQANTEPRASLTSLNKTYQTGKAYQAGEARNAEKKVAATEFSGTRTFLIRGKSQKSLDARNRPMTIDEVRELLNKNK